MLEEVGKTFSTKKREEGIRNLVENNYDFVKVYDGNSVNATLLATLTGNTIPSAIISNGSQMLIHFTSDNIVNKDGFEATWTSSQNNNSGTPCSGTTNLTLASGTFDDGSGNTAKYQNNANCEWLIKPMVVSPHPIAPRSPPGMKS